VLEKLAGLHASVRLEASALPPWDYEADLCERGEALCRTLDRVPRTGELQDLRAALPAVRRLVSDIPSWRAHLLERAPLRQTLIHGDVHTANVLFRGEGADARPVLIDWGRARFGSPLEDVSSWLQSLGYWEPRARRKHDTLLKAYLAQLGLELDDELRRAYWLAGASNALAGALHYHVVCALGADDAAKRGAALHAARDWLRILRGTDIRWRRFGGDPAQRDAGVRRTVG
jgi:Ser/Thr protein kinase RdoA (MazF antagonist)